MQPRQRYQNGKNGKSPGQREARPVSITAVLSESPQSNSKLYPSSPWNEIIPRAGILELEDPVFLWKSTDLTQTTWVWIPALHVFWTLGKLLDLSIPQFPHLRDTRKHSTSWNCLRMKGSVSCNYGCWQILYPIPFGYEHLCGESPFWKALPQRGKHSAYHFSGWSPS